MRGYLKPISTLRKPLHTANMVTKEPVEAAYERSDWCVVPAGAVAGEAMVALVLAEDRKSTRLNSSHDQISYAVFCLKKKTARRSATTISVFGPGSSRPLTKPTRLGSACPQLFLDELTSGTTDAPGTRCGVGDNERAPGKNVSGRSRVIW